MNIKRTIITTIVALALVAVVAPGVTLAVVSAGCKANPNTCTMSELVEWSAQLSATLAGLQGSPQTAGTGGTGACTGITFTRNLTVGSTGSDVKCLQQILNQSTTTQVSATGAGSPGNETSTFASKTLAAVRKYQVAAGFTPANQVGPLTRQKLNAYLGGTYVPPVTTFPAGCTSTSGYSPTTGASCATGVVNVVPTGSGLSVQLASDNPAVTTLVSGSTSTDGQGGADLAHIVFVNGDNAAVNVTNVKLNRLGVSTDSLLNNVYLYQGANRLTDGATVSSGVITFNGNPLFTVPAGSSITIRVVADILYGNSGQTVGVNIPTSASVTTNASSVKGNFPVSGNLMTTASATLATASFAAATSTTPYTSGSSASTVDPQNSYPVWAQTVTIGTRAVTLSRFALYQTGSAPTSAIQNYRLYVDGSQVGSAVSQADVNGYITFDLSSSPITLQTGSRNMKVLADIIGGSSLNFSYALRNSTDAMFTDSQLNVGISPTVSGSTFSQLRSCNYNTTSYGCTINAGSVTIAKTTDSPSGNVVYQASNQVLARYTVTASGEAVKISDLYVGLTDSTGGVTYLANGALYANGVQVGSTFDMPALTYASATSGHDVSLGSSLIVTPGSPVTLEVRSDIKEKSGTTAVAAAQTLQAWISAGSSNATGQTSRNTISTPSSETTGNTLTVSTGTLSLAKYSAYTNQTIVVPQAGEMLGHFTLTGSTTEATNLNTIYVDLSANTTTITGLYVKYGVTGGTMQQTISTATVNKQTGTIGTSTAANSYSINYSLPAGQTVDLEVFGDVNSLASGTVVTYVGVDGTTASSSQTVHSNAIAQGSAGSNVQGQTITFGSGSFVGTQDPATPVVEVVAGGSPITSGIFKFTAQNDSYTINELKFSLGTATSAGNANAAGAITSVALKDQSTGTILATQPVQSLAASGTGATGSQYVAYFTGLNILMSANTVKSIAVVPTLSSTLSVDTNTSNIDVEPYLTYVKASNSSGTPSNSDTTSSMLSTRTANATYVFKSTPSIAFAGADSTASAGAQVELYKYTVTANGGPVAVKQVKFNVTVNSNHNSPAAGANLSNFVFLKNGTDITSSVSIVNLTTQNGVTAGTSLKSTASIGSNTVIVAFTSEDSVTSSTTYQLLATANNFTPALSTYAGDSIQTYIPYDTGWVTTTYPVTVPNTMSGSYISSVSSFTGVQYGFTSTRAGAGACTTSGCNFVWSDNSASNPYIHTYTDAASSADWFNSYEILTTNTRTENITAH